MRGFSAFLRYELLMHRRSWRLWGGLAALLAFAVPWATILAVRPNPNVVDNIARNYLKFVLVDAALFVPVLILITVDTAARLRSTGVHPLVFTKPFPTLSFVMAGWIAVGILAVVLAATVFVVRYLCVRYRLGLEVSLAPLGWLLLFGAVPVAMSTVALVMWVRTVFRHNVGAYVVSAVLLVALAAAAHFLRLPILGWNTELYRPLLEPYIPAIGRDLDWAQYGGAFLNTLLLSLLFVSLACYHMRRREPQSAVLDPRGSKWSDMPTFLQLVHDLRIDRRVGAGTHLLLASTLVLAGILTGRSVVRGWAMTDAMQRWAVEIKKDLREQAPETSGLLVRHYSGDIRIESRRQVACDLRMEIENTTRTTISHLALQIPFGMEIDRFEAASAGALQHRRWGNVVVAQLPTALAPGATTTVRLAYAGRPTALKIGGLVPFSGKYEVHRLPLESVGLSMSRRYLRLNGWFLPRSVALTRHADGIYVSALPRLFTADLELAAHADLDVVSPHGTVKPLGKSSRLARWRFRLTWPRNDFLLLAGPYERIERRFGPLSLCIYCFDADRETVEFVLFELNEMLERWGKILGPSQGPCYALVETPFVPQLSNGRPSGVLYSVDLEQLRRYRALFEKRRPESIRALAMYQELLSRTVAATILGESFHPRREIAPLGPALFLYLLKAVARSEVGPSARANPRLFGGPAFMPVQRRSSGGRHHHRGGWHGLRSRSRRSSSYGRGGPRPSAGGPSQGFLDPRAVSLFSTALIDRMAQPQFNPVMAIHPWRMLRYLLEDDKFAQFLSTLMGESRNRLVGLADIKEIAERVYGEPLDWFFGHWFYGTGVPKYEIPVARADMVENEVTRDVEYDVHIVISNKGRGRMPVPVMLLTDRDVITREVWLDSASSATLTLHVTDRPEMVFVDPEGWITQEAFHDKETGAKGIVRRKVRIVE